MTYIGTPSQIAVTVVRSAFSAVPVVGGALNEVFFDHRSRIKQLRFEELIAGMEEDLKGVSEEAIRKDYLQTEEFNDLLESIVLRVIRTGDPAKRARLRQVLVSQIKAPAPVSDQELFLDVVADITEKELEILRAYGEAYDRPRTDAEPIEKPKRGVFREASSYGLDEPQYRYHVQKLIARGLMYDDGVGRWSTGSMELFEISDLGRAFLRYIAAGAS